MVRLEKDLHSVATAYLKKLDVFYFFIFLFYFFFFFFFFCFFFKLGSKTFLGGMSNILRRNE